MGPVRINLSQSGVGGSIGIKGYRKGVDARGRQYTHKSIPGTGIYSREYEKSKISLDQSLYDHRELNGKGKVAVIAFLAMFLFIWFAGESLFFACLITIPSVFISGIFRNESMYDHFVDSDSHTYENDGEEHIANLEDELSRLEELEQASPFSFFGLSESCSRKELDKAFKNKIKLYHPDRHAELGPELQELAQIKTREIIAAYEKCVEILHKNKSA